MKHTASRIIAILLLLAMPFEAFAETESSPPPPGPPPVANGALPSGFRKKATENPFRRFEIIAFGVFPLALFYADFGFDLEKYIANGFDSTYAPWPFKSDYAPDPTESEYLIRLSIAGGISLAVAGADAVIRAIRYRAAPEPELDSAGTSH